MEKNIEKKESVNRLWLIEQAMGVLYIVSFVLIVGGIALALKQKDLIGYGLFGIGFLGFVIINSALFIAIKPSTEK